MVEEEFRIASSLGTPEAFAQIAAMVHAELDAHPLVGPLTQRACARKRSAEASSTVYANVS